MDRCVISSRMIFKCTFRNISLKLIEATWWKEHWRTLVNQSSEPSGSFSRRHCRRTDWWIYASCQCWIQLITLFSTVVLHFPWKYTPYSPAWNASIGFSDGSKWDHMREILYHLCISLVPQHGWQSPLLCTHIDFMRVSRFPFTRLTESCEGTIALDSTGAFRCPMVGLLAGYCLLSSWPEYFVRGRQK